MHIYVYTDTHLHAGIHSCMQAHVHAFIHTDIHTNACTHTCVWGTGVDPSSTRKPQWSMYPNSIPWTVRLKILGVQGLGVSGSGFTASCVTLWL